MTHAAIVQLLEPVGADVVLRKQRFTALNLVRWRIPFRVENLIGGPQVFLRRIVTIQTPAHVERVRLPRNRHPVHRSVACRAADALLNVYAMIEEDKIGKLIDALPVNWLARREALANWREHGRVLPDLRMASHTGFGRWDAGEGGFLNGSVAITAIQSESRHVMFVTERRWLRKWHVDPGRIRRAIDRVYDAPEPEEGRN